MYLARFSYDVLPINRQRAIDFIRREVEAAHRKGPGSRMLVPLTRGQGGGAALQFEVEWPASISSINSESRCRLYRRNRQLDALIQRGSDPAALRRDPAD